MTIHPDVSGRPHVLLMHERCVSLSLGSLNTPVRLALHYRSPVLANIADNCAESSNISTSTKALSG
jgi:hypothetical protein